MNRRDFIINSSMVLGMPLLSQAFAGAAKPLKMGLQLFTIRDALAKDLNGTLKTVASLGYQDLETYGFEPETNRYYGIDASAFKSMLDRLQLTTSSGHYDFYRYFLQPEDVLRRYVDQCIEGAKALGQKYITWPWLDPESRTIDKFKLLAQTLNKVGEQVNKAGLGFAYHNHDYEFTDQQGVNGYDVLLADTDASLVKLQIDLYWVMHSSKLTPAELFKKQPGRFVMWHIKDMDRKTRDYTELGNGSIDYTAILPYASQSGLQYYFLEQGGNFAVNSMQSIRDSASYFKTNLQALLR
ncbi:sugar phosphate isomerase/epimerase family protein [Dawidia soli]|nr:sugar phosphate isomerase/epimerase [Dawidia soli]